MATEHNAVEGSSLLGITQVLLGNAQIPPTTREFAEPLGQSQATDQGILYQGIDPQSPKSTINKNGTTG